MWSLDGYIRIPDKPTLILVVHKVESVIRPCLLDLPNVLLESHLMQTLMAGRKVMSATYFSLRLNDDFLDEVLVLTQIHVIHMAESHPERILSCSMRGEHKSLTVAN